MVVQVHKELHVDLLVPEPEYTTVIQVCENHPQAITTTNL